MPEYLLTISLSGGLEVFLLDKILGVTVTLLIHYTLFSAISFLWFIFIHVVDHVCMFFFIVPLYSKAIRTTTSWITSVVITS